MAEWFNFFVSVGATSVEWLQTMEIFGVPLISFIVCIFIMGVVLRAALYKA